MTGSDLKFALRTLLRSPLFSCVAVLSLALGIGANTAIFTLLDQLILRLLPVRDPEQLVMITTPGPHMGSNRGAFMSSYPMYQDFQQKGEAFSYVFCRRREAMSISFGGQTERVGGELVSGNFFQALGVAPAVGRVFSPEEDDRVYKGHPVVVLSHDFWVSRFAADPKVVGMNIQVNNYPMTIVGVSAPGFTGLDPIRPPQIRVHIQMKPLMTPGWDDLGNRRSKWVQMFGRLKPGFTVQSAQASLQPLFRQILDYETTLPSFRNVSQYNRKLFLDRKVSVAPAANGYSDMRRQFQTALIVLMCMVGLVLVIACANVANLLIARAVARQKEIAVRLAIGASRGQLIRQLLVESVILSLAGGLVGILLSVWTIRGLLTFLPVEGSPLLLQAEPDLRILGFNLALAFVTGLLFGVAPAMQSTRFELWDTLKDAAGAIAGVGRSVKLRKALVIAQVALSFLLLAGAGLFVKSLSNLKNANTGFGGMSNLITFQVNPSLNGYSVDRVNLFYRQLLENVRNVPGVKTASFASVPLLHGYEWDSSMSVEGHRPKDGEDMQAFMNGLSPRYFQTMDIPQLDGRDFRESDLKRDSKVAIVNRKFAEHFFGNKPAVGRKVGWGVSPETKLDIEIIGVVENSLYEGPREGVRRQIFVANWGPGSVAFYIRAGADSRTLYAALRNEVKKLDASMPVYEMKTLENQLDETLSTERMIAALSAAFGVLATVLAAIGLYGVMAFVVARRIKEIGLRLALGAQPSAVLWLVMREVLILLGVGLAIGVPVAYGLGKYVSSQLFNVKPANAATAALAVAILAAVSLGAGFFPAWKASAVDPMTALRYE